MYLAKLSVFPEVRCFVSATGVLDLECREREEGLTGRLPCYGSCRVGDVQ